MTFMGRGAARGLRGRGWFARLLLGAAVLALLMPSLVAFEPGLAGWLPSHGHVYEGGAVDHAHPWDAVTEGEQAPGVTFTWDEASAVFAVTIPVIVVLSLAATLLVAIERRLPDAPRPVFARIPTPPPR